MRLFPIAILFFVISELHAQGGVGGFVQQVTPGPVRQIVPQQVNPQQLPAQALSPQQIIPKDLEPGHVAQEAGKLIEKGGAAAQAIIPGSPNTA